MKAKLINAGMVLAILLLIGLLSGCETTTKVPEGKVAVTVECKEQEAERPNMPTEALKARGCPSGECVDELLQASLAENLRREGYEVKLRTALRACIAPIGAPSTAVHTDALSTEAGRKLPERP
jgi:hypothetical protein